MVESVKETSVSIASPDQWPPEVKKVFTPVRELGQGGFASVVLARRKDDATLVAMKIVGSKQTTRQEAGYAMREIDILQELSHPNIVRILEHWEPRASTHTCAAVMALEFVDGPTVHNLLETGGRLSLVFARVIGAQLVDAVSYLHYRAVLHRDIKPDNLLVRGLSMDHDEIFEDEEAPRPPSTSSEWLELTKKWHLTLVDFGFARALTPSDIHQKAPSRELQASLIDPNTAFSPLDLDNSSHSKMSSRSLSISRRRPSRRVNRAMSAVGNRAYAAPEVQHAVKKIDASGPLRPYTTQKSIDVTETLSQYVSFYGFPADAFSVGNTLTHMLTGVRPDQDVNQVIAAENSPIFLLCNLLCGTGKSKSGTGRVRKIKYRAPSAIPAEVRRLILGLTHRDPVERTLVQMARRYPYVDEVMGDTNFPLKEIDFLDFIKKQSRSDTKKRAKEAAPLVKDSEDEA